MRWLRHVRMPIPTASAPQGPVPGPRIRNSIHEKFSSIRVKAVSYWLRHVRIPTPTAAAPQGPVHGLWMRDSGSASIQISSVLNCFQAR